MDKLYAHYPFKITFRTNQDITGAAAVTVRFRKPGAAETDILEVAATVVDEVLGIIEAKVTAVQNNTVGKWSAWSYVMFSDGDDQPGEPYIFEMYAEGY